VTQGGRETLRWPHSSEAALTALAWFIVVFFVVSVGVVVIGVLLVKTLNDPTDLKGGRSVASLLWALALVGGVALWFGALAYLHHLSSFLPDD
jgi:hypothetical protein